MMASMMALSGGVHPCGHDKTQFARDGRLLAVQFEIIRLKFIERHAGKKYKEGTPGFEPGTC